MLLRSRRRETINSTASNSVTPPAAEHPTLCIDMRVVELSLAGASTVGGGPSITGHTVGPSTSPSQSLSTPSHVSAEGVVTCSQVNSPCVQRFAPTPHAPDFPVTQVPASALAWASLSQAAYELHWQLAEHERFDTPQSPQARCSVAPGAHSPSLEQVLHPPYAPSLPQPRDWVPQLPQLRDCESPGLHATWPVRVMKPPVK